jgi:hypothetical protein
MRPWPRILVVCAAAAALAAAGIAANLYLLDVGGGESDPVGRLTPRASLTTPRTVTGTTSNQTTSTDDDRSDGHDGDDD